jgi:hypothetical protein
VQIVCTAEMKHIKHHGAVHERNIRRSRPTPKRRPHLLRRAAELPLLDHRLRRSNDQSLLRQNEKVQSSSLKGLV